MRKGKIYNHLSVFSLGLKKRFKCHYSRNFPVTMSSSYFILMIKIDISGYLMLIFPEYQYFDFLITNHLISKFVTNFLLFFIA